ncbi:clock controlled protein [Purpureocillium lavendulum]|uniref:Clock controlled protein n=1 Tax=Purpureocillium lavendulum TaxID=1247861 RepID=A0AB34FLA4_9HYPO|nr:clock controlled protein [Purpureocillium lavendulum]
MPRLATHALPSTARRAHTEALASPCFNLDLPTEPAAPPEHEQLHDPAAVDAMDADQHHLQTQQQQLHEQPPAGDDQLPPPLPTQDAPDDTLGGLDGSPRPQTAASNGGFSNSHHHQHHHQSQSLDQGLPSSPRQHDDDPASRYTPPVSSAPSHSRPASRMSNPSNASNPPPPQSHAGDHRQGSNEPPNGRNHVVIKVGMVGDAQIGKTSLMVKYVEGSWDEDYIQTLGVNFMEKTISIRNTEITFSIWDLGGQREFVNMLPLVCNDAVAILFMFDLTRKSTLNSIKEWYRQGRGFNKTAIPILVGTKYDHFVNFPLQDQEEISNQVKQDSIFKIVLSKAFDLKCTIPEIENVGEPLLLYQSV